MVILRVRVLTHWFNGWFLRAMSRPYLSINGEHHAVRWNEHYECSVSEAIFTIGAGVRYFGRGALLGCEPEHLNVTDAFEAPSATTTHVSFRNGF